MMKLKFIYSSDILKSTVLPNDIQIDCKLFRLANTSANTGQRPPSSQHGNANNAAVFVSMPCFWNGCNIIDTNKSHAVANVDNVDI